MKERKEGFLKCCKECLSGLSIGSKVPTSNPILFGHVKKIEKVCPASRRNPISCPRDHLCIIAQTRSWLAMYRSLDYCSFTYVTCLWNSLHHLVDHYLIIFTVIVPITNHVQKSRLVIKCLDFLPPWWKVSKRKREFQILADERRHKVDRSGLCYRERIYDPSISNDTRTSFIKRKPFLMSSS